MRLKRILCAAAALCLLLCAAGCGIPGRQGGEGSTAGAGATTGVSGAADATGAPTGETASTAAPTVRSTVPTTVPQAPAGAPHPGYRVTVTVDGVSFQMSDGLWAELNRAVQMHPNAAGFYARSTDGRVTIACNPDEVFFAASTLKTFVALYYFTEASKGRIRLDEQLGADTVEQLLTRMLDVSDNQAFLTLRNRVGKQTLCDYADSLGLKEFHITENRNWADATPREAVAVWERVYALKNSCAEGERLFEILVNAKDNRLKAALPAGLTVPHKYGKEAIVYAETGMVIGGGGAYYVALYDNISGEDNRPYDYVDTLAPLIHRAMEEYFNQ